jgi:hypothetical protein
MSDETSLDIDTRADKVTALIETSRRMLADGRPIDLAALEGKVRALCEAATAAPAEERPRLKAVLAEIIDGLDRLTDDLTARHPGLAERDDEDLRRRALGAYGGDG